MITTVIEARPRSPHALLDRESRLRKARKIEAIVGTPRLSRASRILEAGTGSGVIANYLASQYEDASIFATDVVDSRILSDGYTFVQVESTKLPFDSGSFDVAISNHVLEHVGNWDSQLDHLRELERVVANDGIVYLAIPNRWSPYEGHFRLPFLSWPPRLVRDTYVRTMGRGSHYDCEPRGMLELRRLFSCAGFDYTDVTLKALRTMVAIEHAPSPYSSLFQIAAPVAGGIIFPFMPTYVFLLSKRCS